LSTAAIRPIAKAETVSGDAARLGRSVHLRLCKTPGQDRLPALPLLVPCGRAQSCSGKLAFLDKGGVCSRAAPIPASSGNTHRHRLDQGGNRQINAALHRVIVTRARCHAQTRDYIARRRSEGKSTREAIRCLERYLARHVWRLLQPPNRVERKLPPSTS
jgi:hypothetical protein